MKSESSSVKVGELLTKHWPTDAFALAPSTITLLCHCVAITTDHRFRDHMQLESPPECGDSN